MLNKIIACIFLFCFSFGFSTEIRQGTLKNGMRYYLWPDNTDEKSVCGQDNFYSFKRYDSITFVFKKKEHQILFPTLKLLEKRDFFDFIGYKAPFGSISHECLGYWSMSYFFYLSNCISLPNFSDFFNFENISDQSIYKIRKKYWKTRVKWNLGDELSRLVYGYNIKELDFLFSGDNDAIKKACQSLIDPSQMAVIITGHFDSADLEKDLEVLFGDISGDEISGTPLTFKHDGPIFFSKETSNLVDDIIDEEILPDRIYLYFYQFKPTIKNHVLNDLLFSMKFHIRKGFCDIYSEKIGSIVQFLSSEKICTSQFDKALFNQAKRKLEKAYRNDCTSKQDRCRDHFLSNVPDALEANHQNLLRELELVTLEEFCSFVEKYIVNATETTEVELYASELGG